MPAGYSTKPVKKVWSLSRFSPFILMNTIFMFISHNRLSFILFCLAWYPCWSIALLLPTGTFRNTLRLPIALVLQKGGNHVADEHDVGNKGGKTTGVGWIPVEKTFARKVVCRQWSGKHGDAKHAQLPVDPAKVTKA